jgi:hypothetical protein
MVIAGSILVVASAADRVRYYEAAYGFTRQRLYVQVCCAAVALALLSLAWQVRRPIDVARVIRHGCVVAILCAGGLAYWNYNAWIVQANVERYHSTRNLDAGYLGQLVQSSPDAVPALVARLAQLPPAAAQSLREALGRVPLGDEMSWYEWNLRRAAARAALCSAGLLPPHTGSDGCAQAPATQPAAAAHPAAAAAASQAPAAGPGTAPAPGETAAADPSHP